jgi:TusA-related sulfurtransferase
MSGEFLDLRSVACPINFVRTKIKLDNLPNQSLLTVLLDDGEPIESVSKSVIQEGHQVLKQEQSPDGHWILEIQKTFTL